MIKSHLPYFLETSNIFLLDAGKSIGLVSENMYKRTGKEKFILWEDEIKYIESGLFET